MQRNFSMQTYWDTKAASWEPELLFTKDTDYSLWKNLSYDRLLGLLGKFPTPCPLNAEVEKTWQEDGIIYERVVFNSEENMSVPCIVLRPAKMKTDRSHAAVLCCHGHSPYGKYSVAGVALTPELKQNIESHRYDYAKMLAHEGFLTLAPDLRGFGERKDGDDPFPGRDRCNVNFIKGALFGSYTLMLNIWDAKCCIDYLQSRPEVDPSRIGMMGLSYGGTMTTFTAAVDSRIRAACVCGYGGSFSAFAVGRGNFCGAQMLPDLYRYFDLPEVMGLIAPRPLLLNMGRLDNGFTIEESVSGSERVKQIYAAAGKPSSLEIEIHDGGHVYGGERTPEFFKMYL